MNNVNIQAPLFWDEAVNLQSTNFKFPGGNWQVYSFNPRSEEPSTRASINGSEVSQNQDNLNRIYGGQKEAFIKKEGGDYVLFINNLNSQGEPVKDSFFIFDHKIGNLALSTDGSHIAYTEIDQVTGKDRLVLASTKDPKEEINASFAIKVDSPIHWRTITGKDGNIDTLVFTSKIEDKQQVFKVVNPTGKDASLIQYTSEGDYGSPVLSPGGDRFAVVRELDGVQQMVVYSSESKTPIIVDEDGNFDFNQPAWSPMDMILRIQRMEKYSQKQYMAMNLLDRNMEIIQTAPIMHLRGRQMGNIWLALRRVQTRKVLSNTT